MAVKDPTRVPLLSARHYVQRLSWAREHIGWTPDEWKILAWSDESRFQLVRANGRVQVRYRSHEAMEPSCQQGTLQSGGGSIMVFYAFFMAWTGPYGHIAPIIDWKWLCLATWRLLAAIHRFHVPKQRWNFYRWQCVMSPGCNCSQLVWRIF